MKKIILVDDEQKYLDMLTDLLEKNNYRCVGFSEPLDALDRIKEEKFDLLITDLKMKDVDGFQLVQLVRNITSDMPIIMLTGDENDANEVKGLNFDIADYIRKPFNIDIFVTRIRRIIDEKKVQKDKKLYIPESNIVIDYREKLITKDGEIVKLPLKEFEMLALLVQNKNKVLSREDIISEIWGTDLVYVDPRTIDVHVKNIRKVLKLMSIQTVYGIGYRYSE